MRTKIFLAILSCGLLGRDTSQADNTGGVSAKTTLPPRLVVILVVDQMRADYLERFASQYRGGLARLTRDGVVFTNAIHDHALTETAPGHATIATGCYPSRNGIVGNDHYDSLTNSEVYSVDDSSERGRIIGFPDHPGKSPHRLLVPALGDYMKRRNPTAKVGAVSWKDRSAILMGGQMADAVYWMDEKAHGFVTAAYCRKDIPSWVKAFSRGNEFYAYQRDGWAKLRPDSVYTLSGPDEFSAEADGVATTFPHSYSKSLGDTTAYLKEFVVTPFADIATLQFAVALARSEGMGRDRTTDLLCVSLSAADKIGHRYGPDSHEVQDYYLRLDMALDGFLDSLGKISGGSFILALTADHGAMPLPEYLTSQGLTAQRLYADSLELAFHRALDTLFASRGLTGDGLWRSAVEYHGVVLDRRELTNRGVNIPQLRADMAKALSAYPPVVRALSWEELMVPAVSDADTVFSRIQHSFRADRSPDVTIYYRPNFLISWGGAHGTSHGTPYDYDTRVPMVFYGLGHMISSERVRTVDIAATLGMLVGLGSVPCDGRILGLLPKGKLP